MGFLDTSLFFSLQELHLQSVARKKILQKFFNVWKLSHMIWFLIGLLVFVVLSVLATLFLRYDLHWEILDLLASYGRHH